MTETVDLEKKYERQSKFVKDIYNYLKSKYPKGVKKLELYDKKNYIGFCEQSERKNLNIEIFYSKVDKLLNSGLIEKQSDFEEGDTFYFIV